MKTAIKFNKLKGMSDAERLETLAGAISFELEKPRLCLELAKTQALSNVKGVAAANNSPVTFERIKSFLSMKYGTPSDNPILTTVSNDIEQFFHENMPEIDMGYTALFDLVDLRNTTHDHFDIVTTNAGLTYTQRKPGQEVKIRRNITEASTTVTYLEFADGLGLLDQWLQFNQFWNIDEAVAEFRAKAMEQKAALHYGLLTALGAGVNQAFDTDDTKTFNAAAAAILRAVRGKGYAVSQNTGFYIVCAPEHVGRIERMLTAQRGSAMVDYGTVGEPITYRVEGIISTTEVPAASTGYYLVLPRHKMKRGEWMDLHIESARNIYVSARDMVGREQYNAAIGDTDQVKRVLFS